MRRTTPRKKPRAPTAEQRAELLERPVEARRLAELQTDPLAQRDALRASYLIAMTRDVSAEGFTIPTSLYPALDHSLTLLAKYPVPGMNGRHRVPETRRRDEELDMQRFLAVLRHRQRGKTVENSLELALHDLRSGPEPGLSESALHGAWKRALKGRGVL